MKTADKTIPEEHSRLLVEVQMPLENVEFAIGRFLDLKAHNLDTETHALLVGVRASVARTADSVRDISRDPERPSRPTTHTAPRLVGF